MESFQIPSHGLLLNAFAYVAAGSGPHPVVVLLHGFPGNERNLDLAQDMRNAGWDVLYVDYRGSWGTPGNFSFSNAIEDASAVVSYLRQPTTQTLLRVDSSRIVLFGHSMGGFVAVEAAALDHGIRAIVLVSATDLGGRIPQPLPEAMVPAAVEALSQGYAAEGMAPLAGCSAESLARETLAHATTWRFLANVNAFAARPVFVVTSDDGFESQGAAFAAALGKAGNGRVTTLHLPTDHAYSSERRALSSAVLRWLAATDE